MYSLILVTALTPGGDHRGPVGFGCAGPVAGCYGSCHGGYYAQFPGSGMFGRRHSCLGCASYNCSGWNCFGSCHGYFAPPPASCHGCGGCYGCYGAHVMGPTVAMPPYTLLGPGAGYGCSGVYGSVTNMNPPVMVIPPEPKVDDKKDGGKKEEGNDGSAASLKIRLPAAAKLYVDDRPTTLTGAERVFATPPLGAGRFFYDVRAELVVDGKTVVEEKRVVVEAGATVTETFGKLLAAAEGAAAVAGK